MNFEDLSLENEKKDTTDDFMHVAVNTSYNDHELSSFIPSNMFLIGYTECAREALRNLTEVEKLPANHPVIVRLKLHLYEQYNLFQIQRIIRNALSISDKENENFESGLEGSTDNTIVSSKKDSICFTKDLSCNLTNCSVDEESDLEETNKSHTDSKNRNKGRKGFRKLQSK